MPANVRRLQDFPIASFLPAFDLAVSACGYNSFHEILSLGLPAVLMPNENPMMDAQEVRALWADRRGHAVCVRATRPIGWPGRSSACSSPTCAPGSPSRRGSPALRRRPRGGTLIADLAGSLTAVDRPRPPGTQALLRAP